MLLNAHGTSKGKIGVFIEEHFDMTEYRLFNNDCLLKVLISNIYQIFGVTPPYNLAPIQIMAGLKNI